MTGDFSYYDKLDFDLKSPMHMFRLPLLCLGELGGRGWGWALPEKAAGSSPGPSDLLSFMRLRIVRRRPWQETLAGDCTETTFRRRKLREKTPLVPSS